MSKESATRLLLVEDNPGDVRLLREMFNESGSHNIELMCAESMSEAEKHLTEREVDVVLLDLGLPDAQGLAAVRRAHAAAPRVPLVVLTSLDDESLAVRALREGAQDYLVKGQIESRGLMRAVLYAIERKHAEQALQAAEEALHRTTHLLETSQAVARIGGWELDVVHDALYWSAETYRIHEVSPAEYSPTLATAIGFYAPESIPLITAAVQDAIERGTPFDLELELITATGRRVSVRAMSTLTIEQGRTTKITGAFQDISEHKRLEDQLRQAQRLEAVGQLAGGIAHDFNNLLTAIRGYAELARRGLSADEGRRDDLDQVIANADRAAALIRQLLAFSRRQVLQSEVLDPAAIVEGIAPLLRRLLGEHIELATCMAPGLGRVTVDPSQLEQVVVNLAVNAADAMPDGGKLTIELSNVELDAAYGAIYPDAVPGPHVLLAVSDIGTGMDAATKARAFEPFFTTKGVGKGTGMGLATVYGIVKQSGGSVNLYSEPGQGTTFRIYLPAVAQEPTAAVAEAPAARPSSSGAQTILLVEDEPAVRAFARRTLEEQGYTVLEAAAGAEALAIAASHAGPIALLVTDVVMPGLQGHQLAAQLTATRPELRVLYVSGFTENSVIHHGLPDHGVAFLAKPFSVDTLGEAVRRVLDRPPA
jgi:signal transduction histidine kinase/FixJ family two-component response regulator